MGSLKTKIFIFFVTLLMVVQATSLWTVYNANTKQGEEQIQSRLNAAKSVFETQYQQRSYYLQAFAETAAKDFGLKEVFGADQRSFLIALNNHRKRIDADIAVAVDQNQSIVGQLIRRSPNEKISLGPDQGNSFPTPDWFTGEKAFTHLYQQGQQLYQLSFAPLKSGQQIVGWIGYGYQINAVLAQTFADITGLSIEFMLEQTSDNWRSIAAAIPSNYPLAPSQQGLNILQNTIPENLIATQIKVGVVSEQPLHVTIFGSRSNLLETLQDNWWHLLALEGGMVSIVLFAAYLLAGGITRPVRKLVRQAQFIARGNYESSVDIVEKNELGQLANEFNQMQKAVLVREQKISHQLKFNSLTNLPNRYSLLQTLDDKLKEQGSAFSLLHLDIRRTRTVNDTLGYQIGDLMIQEVGKRLVRLNANSQTFHLDGDEFAMIIESANLSELANWQTKIEEAMDEPLCGEDTLLHLQLQIGFARAPDDAKDPQQLLQKADTALSHGKREQRNFQQYLTEMDADANRRLSLVNDLKIAIEQNQLCLFYQPKLDLNSGKIHHLEALVRWQHPLQGMIPPDAFISIAEQTGQIDALSNWVLNEAACQYRTWSNQGLDLSIAVNISADNLKNQRFTESLRKIWSQHQLPANALSLEVTESAVVSDPESAIHMLCEIRDQGIKLSIDDYGTGYSSLAQLKQMPVSELKIDRSFVDKVHLSSDDQIIVRSTIRMAHDMGLSVVAEGIEDKDTLLWLQEHDCDLAQGYFISRPLPADEFSQWLLSSDFNPTQLRVLHG
ncbi:GGDEF domain-containing phosphodiesterase [Neptuniibacter caesariensis]|uniref:cyclic-guanylate-specific phosphodiesterase n=1 Tax=Neptuniibacter caesariensis TaxID=207954 RepID=A0A7U8C798_NEPCE|nr:GGDEF domain-containing phosphodiesterase [Neptuniibacter caesariensis]EAR61174.1 sensory box sensor/GGDEF/EAL domain protein [Oceanospirillum sp. MED92] [Neptuniibacter caesariensis]